MKRARFNTNRKNAMSHTHRRDNRKFASEPNSQQIKDFSNTARELDSVDVLESYNGGCLINFNLSGVKNALTVRVSDSELQTVYDALDWASDFSIDGKSFRYTGDEWQIWSHSGSGGFTIQDTVLTRIKPELMNLMSDNRTSRRANHKRAYFGGERDWEDVAFDGDPIYGSSGEGPDGFYYSFYVYADDFNLVFEAQNEDTLDPEESWTFEHGGDIPSGEYLAALGDAMATDFVRTGGVSNPIGKVFRRANRKVASVEDYSTFFIHNLAVPSDVGDPVDYLEDFLGQYFTDVMINDYDLGARVGDGSRSMGFFIRDTGHNVNDIFYLNEHGGYRPLSEIHIAKRANRKRASLMSLDEALQQVANASFYEDKQITPETDGNGNIAGYRVEDDYGMSTDDWQWTYDQGLMDADSVSETSRLMDHYEHFANAEHIRYHMDESVKALESGQTVTFAYAIVSDADAIFDEETQDYYDADGDPTDDVAGWILTADWF